MVHVPSSLAELGLVRLVVTQAQDLAWLEVHRLAVVLGTGDYTVLQVLQDGIWDSLFLVS